MKKFRLLLLDANVVIELFRRGIWDRLLESCDVQLARTVVSVEAHFFLDDDGQRQDFDLGQYVQSHKITVFDVSPADLAAFRGQFDVTYFERLDPGETESLVFLVKSAKPYLICSADGIVYRVLGNIDRAEQGISLEEILQQIGLGRKLTWPFTRAFREHWTQKGFQDRVGGSGHRANLT